VKTSDKFRDAIPKDLHQQAWVIGFGLIMDQLDDLLAEFQPKPPPKKK
jgi:hypothetical protein